MQCGMGALLAGELSRCVFTDGVDNDYQQGVPVMRLYEQPA